MPISRFPRPNRRIAPHSLRSILHVPATLPDSDSPPPSLYELDETVWSRYNSATCDSLARQVIESVSRALPPADPNLARSRIPSVPKWVSLDDLELEARTRNLLAEEGYEEDLAQLNLLTVDDLLQIPGFGGRCLVDLLTAMENFDLSVVSYPWASRRFSQILSYETENLSTNPDASLVHRDDPRFRSLMLSIHTLLPARTEFFTLRDLVEMVRSQAADLRKPVELINALQDLRIRLDTAAHMSLEEELVDLVAGVEDGRGANANARNRTMLCLRMGWDGGGRRTLQEVADRFDLTRESVRKACNNLLTLLEESRPFAPTLTRSLTLLRKSVPTAADEFEGLLQSDGLTRGRFELEGLLSAAAVLGWETNIRIANVEGRRFAVSAEQERLPAAVLKVAREAVTHWGMANVGDVATKITSAGRLGRGQGLTARFVVQVLERVDGLHWLDSPGGWFWLAEARHNRLLTQIRKVLAVAGRLGIVDLRRGIARHHRMEGFAPPTGVLLELCRLQPEYRIEGETVIASSALDWREVLGSAERLMVEVLLDNGRVMEVVSFELECRRRGLKESTFYTYLDYSPLLIKHARSIYGLRGSIRPETSVPRPRIRQRVLVGHRREDDGSVSLEYSLSRSAVKGGIVSVPAALNGELAGEYDLFAANGSAVGTLKIDRGLAWRLGPFFRQAGVRPGDGLKLELHAASRRAVVARTEGNASAGTAEESGEAPGDAVVPR